MEQTIEYDCECEACKGSGVFVGMAERDGAAVVCHTCKGTGHRHIVVRYRDFEGRRERGGVKRVFRTNPGIGIGENERIKLTDFGGLPYADWLKGATFGPGTEDRQHTCPAWFYQGVPGNLKPNWRDGEPQCQNLGGRFSDCGNFCIKHKCWERWDKEFAPRLSGAESEA